MLGYRARELVSTATSGPRTSLAAHRRQCGNCRAGSKESHGRSGCRALTLYQQVIDVYTIYLSHLRFSRHFFACETRRILDSLFGDLHRTDRRLIPTITTLYLTQNVRSFFGGKGQLRPHSRLSTPFVCHKRANVGLFLWPSGLVSHQRVLSNRQLGTPACDSLQPS